MRQGTGSLFVAFLVSLAMLGFGLACLLLSEQSQRESFGLPTTRNSRRLRVLGWIAISIGIPSTITFVEEWLENLLY